MQIPSGTSNIYYLVDSLPDDLAPRLRFYRIRSTREIVLALPPSDSADFIRVVKYSPSWELDQLAPRQRFCSKMHYSVQYLNHSLIFLLAFVDGVLLLGLSG